MVWGGGFGVLAAPKGPEIRAGGPGFRAEGPEIPAPEGPEIPAPEGLGIPAPEGPEIPAPGGAGPRGLPPFLFPSPPLFPIFSAFSTVF